VFEHVSFLRAHFKRVHMMATVDDSSEETESSDGSPSLSDSSSEESDNAKPLAASVFRRGPLQLVHITSPTPGGHPLSPPVPVDVHAWLYRAMLRTSGNSALAAAVDDAFEDAPLTCSPSDVWAAGETMAILLLQSGFFAAAVFRLVPRKGLLGGSEAEAGLAVEPQAVLHKRFHRYTTRRKQGGSQSAHDASRGGPAKSAGAQLRRAGEVHLQEDINGLLGDETAWAPALRGCRRIFFAAPRRGGQTLWDGRTLVKGDPRLHRVPMMTARPSLAEAVRIAETLVALRPADVAEVRGACAAAGAAAGVPRRAAERKPAAGRSRRGAAGAGAADDAAAASAPLTRAGSEQSNETPAAAGPAARGTPAGRAFVRFGAAEQSSDDGSSSESEGGGGLGERGVEAAVATRAQRQAKVPAAAKPASVGGGRAAPAAAPAAGHAAADEEEEEEAALAAASEAARAERRQLEGAAGEAGRLREAAADVEEQAAALAARVRVPFDTLSRAVGLADAVARLLAAEAAVLAALGRGPAAAAVAAAATGGSGASKRGGKGSRTAGVAAGGSEPVAVQLVAMARVCGELARLRDAVGTALALLAEGASASEALTAIGLEGLGAAALVAGSGMFVDWRTVQLTPTGGGGGVDGEGAPASAGRAKAKPGKAGKAGKGGKGKRGRGKGPGAAAPFTAGAAADSESEGDEGLRVALAASAAAADSPTTLRSGASLSVHATAAPLAVSLSPRELMRRAALSRLQSAMQQQSETGLLAPALAATAAAPSTSAGAPALPAPLR
jgi:hypothetical protein